MRHRAESECVSVDDAIHVVSDIVSEQNAGDQRYLAGQLYRFRRATTRILELRPPPCRVLDIGSHYLHQASLLRVLGYEVVGIDVPLFSQAEFVRKRAGRLGIANLSIENLERGPPPSDLIVEEGFDVIVFTAILEHITFNPVALWQRIYNLMSDHSFIYLTTPNAMRPRAMLEHFMRLVSFAGVGISVADVIGTVTYGHHWKEYSHREVREYFRALSPDFIVETTGIFDAPRRKGLGGLVARVAGLHPILRPEIEAIVSLRTKSGAFALVPQLPFTASSRVAASAG